MRTRTTLAILSVLALSAMIAGCVPPATGGSGAGVTVKMDATVSPLDPDFFSLPWPNQIRHDSDGHLDLWRFPGTAESLGIAYVVSQVGSAVTDFGTQTAVYVRFTGPLDPASLPAPASSAVAGSTVQLVERDNPAARVPVIVRIEPADSFRGPNLLSLLPYPGHTLKAGTDYLVVITTGVMAADGSPLRPAGLIEELDSDEWAFKARSGADWAELRDQRDDARAALESSGVWRSEDLVGFTAFRTQDSTAEVEAVSATTNRLEFPPPELEPTACSPGQAAVVVSGTVQLPLFQAGDYPFEYLGGAIVTVDGEAVVQRWQDLAIALRIPCGEAPEGGWPIQTFINGTGGGAKVDKAYGVSDRAIMASVPPLYGLGSPFVDATETTYYNAYNPVAARANQVQQAAHNLGLIRVVQDLSLDGAPFGSSGPVTTNDTAITISGQSQGAQTLPLVAWAEPEVDAVIAGAGGAGYYNQVSYRTSSRVELAKYVGRVEDYDIRNPVSQLVSTLVDNSEPANFPNSAHYLNFTGEADSCLVLESARHLAGAQQLALVGASLPSVFGEPSLDPVRLVPPVSGNAGGRTRVSLELPGGHYNAGANPELATAFAEAALDGATPVVDDPLYYTERNCSEVRYGEFASGD